MAVYTMVPAEALSAFLDRFDCGELLSAKGIAEGVSNSNFLVETTGGRFILTLYERRIDFSELPFFIDLMEHLADAGLPVPRPIHARDGATLHQLQGRHACLIQFLPGVSVTRPTARQAYAAGSALARVHLAGRSFAGERRNHLALDWWKDTASELGDSLDRIEAGLSRFVAERMRRLDSHWPSHLPSGIVHADLFPDNVLMLGDTVTGLIDFYFACTDLFAYDLAVLRAAWAFPENDAAPDPSLDSALLEGYAAVRPLSPEEEAALPLLGEGASMRFLLSRAQDWLAPAEDALVERKDPLPFVRRLRHYASLSDNAA